MKRSTIEKKILKLLKHSSISNHNKTMITNLLSSFTLPVLKKILNTLENEVIKFKKITDKKNRIELKYQVLLENLCKIKKNP